MLRFRLAWALLGVVVVALFLGAMREASTAVEQTAFFLIYVGYLALTLLAILAGRRWPGLLGFVIFGWAYFVPVFVLDGKPWGDDFPTNLWVKHLAFATNRKPSMPEGFKLSVSPTGNLSVIQTIPLDSINPMSAGSSVGGPPAPGSSIDLTQVPPDLLSAYHADLEDNSRTLEAFTEKLVRAMIIGQLGMTILCSTFGMIMAILFNRWLIKRNPVEPNAK